MDLLCEDDEGDACRHHRRQRCELREQVWSEVYQTDPQAQHAWGLNFRCHVGGEAAAQFAWMKIKTHCCARAFRSLGVPIVVGIQADDQLVG